ncbi:MAG TPA: hypothetical protein VF342_17365 [Alphaproteobacteria bacterium]
MLPRLRHAAALGIGFLLVACGPPDSAEVFRKAEGVKTKTELEQAIGRPDEVSKLGPIETWTYKTSDGAVSFLITGERVQLATGSSRSR